ncbi:MAG: DUF2309 domain-containing protein [Microbacteriaceae bacterium]
MSLILRAQTAVASQDVVSSWPVESFIAVNPLAGLETQPFSKVTSPEVELTRSRDAFLAELASGRITDADLEAALLESSPELAGEIAAGDAHISALSIALCDMKTALWEGSVIPDSPLSWLDEYLASWISSYLSPDPLWPMPHKHLGFYGAWKSLARHDSALPKATRRVLTTLPPEPDAALSAALEALDIASVDVPATLKAELTALPGWVGHIKWRAEKIGDIDVISYLAVRMTVRAALGREFEHAQKPSDTDAGLSGGNRRGRVATAPTIWGRAAKVAAAVFGDESSEAQLAAVVRVLGHHPVETHKFTWQKAYELHYRTELIPKLLNTPASVERPDVQVVMCIDPRSEGMRRHLEESSHIETYGFAGFFGIPVRFARYQARGSIDALPALLSPKHSMTEVPENATTAVKHIARGRTHEALRHAGHAADSATTTPFALAEATGWFSGLNSALQTFTPALHARLRAAFVPAADSLTSSVTIADTFSAEERATLAETAVRMMGMTRVAPLVILAGHTSESMNNLYQSALDCGACGGNPGAANARAAAAVFNDPQVRTLLTLRGIDIPQDSVFVAAEHNTVTDAITLLDRHLIPESHLGMAREFERRQDAAADALVRERAVQLPGASSKHSLSRVRGRANDWAEVYPELGLAGNAAMIIGPRAMTRSVDLERRVFLHSYESDLDPTGTALETIMTAPLVVAQWINHQYYFSTLDPTRLGAGTKTVHNAIGTIGVLSGHSGDLRRGLPWQSVGVGTEIFHEPMRLTVVVQAPLETVGAIVSRNHVLRNLFDNDWITLTARDDTTAEWHTYTPYGWKLTSTRMKGL